MGWLFTHFATRADIIKERLRPWENEDAKGECLKHALRGNVLWTVWHYTYKDGRPDITFIGCDLLAPHPKNGGFEGWGYKDMDESVHPYYYTCPLSFLKGTKVCSPEWRALVREHHARRYQKLTIGMKARLVKNTSNTPYVVITSLRPLRGVFNGITFKIRRSLLAPPDQQPYIEEEKHDYRPESGGHASL